jgi:hypothetical protein
MSAEAIQFIMSTTRAILTSIIASASGCPEYVAAFVVVVVLLLLLLFVCLFVCCRRRRR